MSGRHTVRAGDAACAFAFAPAEWLRRFAEVGGWWIVSADGRISLGWMIEGYSVAENAAAAALWRDVKREAAKLGAIRDHLHSTPRTRAAGDHRRAFHVADQFAPPRGHRLAMLVGIGDTAEAPDPGEAAWAEAFEAFDRADAEEDEHRRAVYREADQLAVSTHADLPAEIQARNNALSDATDAALLALFATPAPDRAALRWKLDFLIDDRGAIDLPAWDRTAGAQLRADIARFLGDGA